MRLTTWTALGLSLICIYRKYGVLIFPFMCWIGGGGRGCVVCEMCVVGAVLDPLLGHKLDVYR